MDCEKKKKNIYLFIHRIGYRLRSLLGQLKQEENEDIGDIHSNSKFRTHLETYIYRE